MNELAKELTQDAHRAARRGRRAARAVAQELNLALEVRALANWFGGVL